jgi:hypothetical protein
MDFFDGAMLHGIDGLFFLGCKTIMYGMQSYASLTVWVKDVIAKF